VVDTLSKFCPANARGICVAYAFHRSLLYFFIGEWDTLLEMRGEPFTYELVDIFIHIALRVGGTLTPGLNALPPR